MSLTVKLLFIKRWSLGICLEYYNEWATQSDHEPLTKFLKYTEFSDATGKATCFTDEPEALVPTKNVIFISAHVMLANGPSLTDGPIINSRLRWMSL